jgi:hypothetical protein
LAGCACGDHDNWVTLAAAFGALFAAVAATASWASVRQTRKIWDESRLPLLHLSTTVDVPSGGVVTVHVRNGGGGVARYAHVFLLEGREALLTPLPPEAMLAPGEAVRLHMPWRRRISDYREMSGVVFCEDAGGSLHAWAGGGAYKRWSNRQLKRHAVTNLEVVRHFFPATPDPETMVRAEYTSFEKV